MGTRCDKRVNLRGSEEFEKQLILTQFVIKAVSYGYRE
jgi:hypothetical protein